MFNFLFLTLGLVATPQEATIPKYLYKVVTAENWQESQDGVVKLSSDDQAFVHFSQDDQLNRILNKYWSDSSEFMILKVETEKLDGNLVYETNPGGVAKYYHLYDGMIPLESVAEARHIIQSEESRYSHEEGV